MFHQSGLQWSRGWVPDSRRSLQKVSLCVNGLAWKVENDKCILNRPHAKSFNDATMPPVITHQYQAVGSCSPTTKHHTIRRVADAEVKADPKAESKAMKDVCEIPIARSPFSRARGRIMRWWVSQDPKVKNNRTLQVPFQYVGQAGKKSDMYETMLVFVFR